MRQVFFLGFAFATLAFVAAPADAVSLDAQQREALSSVDTLFTAMAGHDVAAARAVLMPGAAFVVHRPDGQVKLEHDADFLDALAKKGGAWRERIWQPTVLVDGDLAQVWAPYDFHLDGKFSHCGIDSFSLVRQDGRWRIAGISYSVQLKGCATDPATHAVGSRPRIAH